MCLVTRLASSSTEDSLPIGSFIPMVGLSASLFDVRQNVVKFHVGIQGISSSRVVPIAGGGLIQEANRVYDTDFTIKDIDRFPSDLVQRFGVEHHNSISSLNVTVDMTLTVRPVCRHHFLDLSRICAYIWGKSFPNLLPC